MRNVLEDLLERLNMKFRNHLEVDRDLLWYFYTFFDLQYGSRLT